MDFKVRGEQLRASQVVLVVENLPTSAGDGRGVSSVLGSGRTLGVEHGNPLQCTCLEHSKDRGAWQATVHRAAKSWTWLKWLSMYACMRSS